MQKSVEEFKIMSERFEDCPHLTWQHRFRVLVFGCHMLTLEELDEWAGSSSSVKMDSPSIPQKNYCAPEKLWIK